MDLEVTTSPRSTWVWAADIDEAQHLRGLLEAAGCSVSSAAGRNSEPRVLDLDIGHEAYEGLDVLINAGYALRWHHTQGIMDQGRTVRGHLIDGPNPE